MEKEGEKRLKFNENWCSCLYGYKRQQQDRHGDTREKTYATSVSPSLLSQIETLQPGLPSSYSHRQSAITCPRMIIGLPDRTNPSSSVAVK